MSDDNNNIGFSFDDVPEEEDRSFKLLPKGDYTAMITSAEVKSPKSGGEDCLYLEFTCEDEDGNGGKVWETLPIYHPTATFGKSRLKSICFACGYDVSPGSGFVFNPDCSQIADRTVKAEVYVSKSKNPDYPDDKNRIGRVYSLETVEEETKDREAMPSFS